ncbi:MAG: hypothetical protein V9H25_21520 [Candidatus Competibacter sp.]|jgi:hypothetical protein
MTDIRAVLKTLAIALPFGLAAFICVYGGLTAFIAGTGAITDPREIFVTLGAALTGPVGAVLIGVLAGIYDPSPGLYPVTIAMHVAGALWMAFAYKKLVFEKFSSWLFFPAWIGLIAVYYFGVCIPVLVFGAGLSPDLFARVFRDGTPGQALLDLYISLWPEVTLTSLITAVFLTLIPKKSRKPLW